MLRNTLAHNPERYWRNMYTFAVFGLIRVFLSVIWQSCIGLSLTYVVNMDYVFLAFARSCILSSVVCLKSDFWCFGSIRLEVYFGALIFESDLFFSDCFVMLGPLRHSHHGELRKKLKTELRVYFSPKAHIFFIALTHSAVDSLQLVYCFIKYVLSAWLLH